MQQTRLQCGSIKTIRERERERDRERETSLQAQNTDSERLLSAASHVSDEKRKGGCCWLLMIEIVKWISK